MFAVLSHHVSLVFPTVSLANFIDDCKIWSSSPHHTELLKAFQEVESFDIAVGQVLNIEKTVVMSRFKKKAARFLRDVRRPFTHKQGAKSLGFSQRASKRPSAKQQTARVAKALPVLKKISRLPLGERDKILHIHSNAHAKWLYGTEVQAPTRADLSRLRTAVVSCLTRR